MVKLPAIHCSCYELEISWEKILAAILRPGKIRENYQILGYTVPLPLGFQSFQCPHVQEKRVSLVSEVT